MSKPWTIYALTDPRDGVVRYVGKTYNAKKRLLAHISEAARSRRVNKKCSWIKELLLQGGSPTMSVLETGAGAGWQEAEKRWIKNFLDAGVRLTNATDGGEAPMTGRKHTPEALAKMSASHLGRRLSEAAKQRIAFAHRGMKASTETRVKLSKLRKGVPLSVKHAAAVALANKSKWTAEAKAKLVATQTGRKHTLVTRQKMCAAQLRRWSKHREVAA